MELDQLDARSLTDDVTRKERVLRDASWRPLRTAQSTGVNLQPANCAWQLLSCQLPELSCKAGSIQDRGLRYMGMYRPIRLHRHIEAKTGVEV